MFAKERQRLWQLIVCEHRYQAIVGKSSRFILLVVVGSLTMALHLMSDDDDGNDADNNNNDDEYTNLYPSLLSCCFLFIYSSPSPSIFYLPSPSPASLPSLYIIVIITEHHCINYSDNINHHFAAYDGYIDLFIRHAQLTYRGVDKDSTPPHPGQDSVTPDIGSGTYFTPHRGAWEKWCMDRIHEGESNPPPPPSSSSSSSFFFFSL